MKAVLSVALCAIFVTSITAANAQSPRAGQVELTAGAAYSFSDSVEGRNGSSLDVSSRTGFRVGMEYFTTPRLSLGFDATWVRPSYRAELIPDDGSPAETISYRASIFSGQFTGTYYFLEGAVTPFVEAGLGWTIAFEPADRDFIGRQAVEAGNRVEQRFAGGASHQRRPLRARGDDLRRVPARG